MKKSDVELVEAIIDKMRELVDYYPKVRAFYEGKKPLKPYDFLSRKMCEEDWDIIALLGVAMDEGFWLGDMPKELKGPFKDAHIALVGVFLPAATIYIFNDITTIENRIVKLIISGLIMIMVSPITLALMGINIRAYYAKIRKR